MNNKQKNSSIELLRIICMILIIAHHYRLNTSAAVLNRVNFSGTKVYINAIAMFGKAACSVFALITGYYMINANIDWKKIKRKVFSLLALGTFYSIIIYLIFILFFNEKLTFKGAIRALFPFIYGESWYVAYYILLLLCIPFINIVIHKIEQQLYKKILLIILFVWSLIPTIFCVDLEFSYIDFFIVMYIIGAYIRLYPNKTENNLKNICIVIISAVIIIISILVNFSLGIALESDYFMGNTISFMNINNIINVIFSIYLFKTFIYYNYYNKVINFISGTILGIYIIHDNSYIRKWLWYEIYPNNQYVNKPYLHSVVKITLVFVICFIIELIRKYVILKPIEKIYKKHKKKKIVQQN